jgi:hypothetical protein
MTPSTGKAKRVWQYPSSEHPTGRSREVSERLRNIFCSEMKKEEREKAGRELH